MQTYQRAEKALRHADQTVIRSQPVTNHKKNMRGDTHDDGLYLASYTRVGPCPHACQHSTTSRSTKRTLCTELARIHARPEMLFFIEANRKLWGLK